MRPSELKEEIIARHTNGVNRSLLVEGSPGLGKTEIGKQAAHDLSVGCMVIHAPLMQPEDYGFPVISVTRDNVQFIVSRDKFPLVGSDNCPEHGILIIDELSQADNSAQKILANIIQAREIHGQRIKPGWTIIATGNRTKDRAGANRILGQLGNRVCRVELEVSLDDWCNWALANNVPIEVISFLRFRPELLNHYDPQQDINPTPRSWAEGVAKSIGTTAPTREFEVFKGDVGEGAAAEFTAFLKIYRKLPSPDAVLLNPTTTAVPNDPATLYALCGALAQRTTQVNFGAAITYVQRMPAEFSVLYVKDAIKKTPEIQNTRDYITWATGAGAKILT